MAISKKQKELDVMKWNKSVELGKDACGSFPYCANCDKSLENPCDVAFTKTAEKANVAKAPAKKTPVAKAPAKKPAKKTNKK